MHADIWGIFLLLESLVESMRNAAILCDSVSLFRLPAETLQPKERQSMSLSSGGQGEESKGAVSKLALHVLWVSPVSI